MNIVFFRSIIAIPLMYEIQKVLSNNKFNTGVLNWDFSRERIEQKFSVNLKGKVDYIVYSVASFDLKLKRNLKK